MFKWVKIPVVLMVTIFVVTLCIPSSFAADATIKENLNNEKNLDTTDDAVNVYVDQQNTKVNVKKGQTVNFFFIYDSPGGYSWKDSYDKNILKAISNKPNESVDRYEFTYQIIGSGATLLNMQYEIGGASVSYAITICVDGADESSITTDDAINVYVDQQSTKVNVKKGQTVNFFFIYDSPGGYSWKDSYDKNILKAISNKPNESVDRYEFTYQVIGSGATLLNVQYKFGSSILSYAITICVDGADESSIKEDLNIKISEEYTTVNAKKSQKINFFFNRRIGGNTWADSYDDSVLEAISNGVDAFTDDYQFTYKVVDDGTTVLKVDYISAENLKKSYIITIHIDGACIKGDVNNDGKIDIIDASMLKKFLLKKNITLNLACSDMNGDGKINVVDYLLLRKNMSSSFYPVNVHGILIDRKDKTINVKKGEKIKFRLPYTDDQPDCHWKLTSDEYSLKCVDCKYNIPAGSDHMGEDSQYTYQVISAGTTKLSFEYERVIGDMFEYIPQFTFTINAIDDFPDKVYDFEKIDFTGDVCQVDGSSDGKKVVLKKGQELHINLKDLEWDFWAFDGMTDENVVTKNENNYKAVNIGTTTIKYNLSSISGGSTSQVDREYKITVIVKE